MDYARLAKFCSDLFRGLFFAVHLSPLQHTRTTVRECDVVVLVGQRLRQFVPCIDSSFQMRDTADGIINRIQVRTFRWRRVWLKELTLSNHCVSGRVGRCTVLLQRPLNNGHTSLGCPAASRGQGPCQRSRPTSIGCLPSRLLQGKRLFVLPMCDTIRHSSLTMVTGICYIMAPLSFP